MHIRRVLQTCADVPQADLTSPRRRRGATAIEYVCTVSFIISVCFTALDWLGLSVSERFNEATKYLADDENGNNGNNGNQGNGNNGQGNAGQGNNGKGNANAKGQN
jgi:Flp pilus assembly pilin Flp